MNETIFPWLEQNPTLIGVIVIPAIAAIIGVVFARYPRVSELDVLRYPTSRAKAIADYRRGGFSAYIARLERLTTWADRFYGPRLVSPQAFVRCFQIALLYPLLALLLGWLISDAATLGGFPLFDTGHNFGGRLWRTAVLLVSWAVGALILSKAYNFADFAFAAVDKRLPDTTHRAGFLTKAARWVAPHFAFAGAVLVFVAGADPELATVWLMFFLVLPLLNATADAASVAVTRSFLRHIKNHENPTGLGLIFWDLVLDLFAAALCLLGLLLSIWITLNLWAWLAPDTLLFNWRTYIGTITAGDWGHGTALYLMVFTTLLPTIIHVIAGFGAFLTQKSRLMHRVADGLETKTGELDDYDLSIAMRDLRRATFWGYAASALLVLCILALIFAIIRAML